MNTSELKRLQAELLEAKDKNDISLIWSLEALLRTQFLQDNPDVDKPY